MKISVKKIVRYAVSATLVMALFAGCTDGSVGGADSAEEGDLNETKTLVLGSVRDIIPGEGDGYYVSGSANVWESLTGDVEGRIVPALAKSWEFSEDAREWTFYLRDDVSFHDGVKFNADALLANIERYKNGPFTSTYTTIDINKTFPGLIEAIKVDDYTVKFVFEDPTPTLDYMVSSYGTPIYSPSCFDPETGEITSFVQGTGRYKILEHVPDQYAVFERNDDYYGDYMPKVKTIRVNAIPDSDTRYASLKAEEVMALIDNGSLKTAVAEELVATDDRFGITVLPSHMTHFLKVNGTQFPFDDVRMRQAVSLSIDRETINEHLYGGLVGPAYSVLSWRTPFHKEISGEYSMEKAKELIDEVSGGERLEIDLLVSESRMATYPYKAQAEYMQLEFAKIGIDANIHILENSMYNARLEAGDYHATLSAHGFNNADPYANFLGYIGTEGTSNTRYNFGYSNKEVDDLLAEVRITADESERIEIYNRIQDIAGEELPMIPLLYDVSVNVYNKQIKGYLEVPGIGWATIEWVQ